VAFIEEGGTLPRVIVPAPSRIALVGTHPGGLPEPRLIASAADAAALAAESGADDTLGYAVSDFVAAGGRRVWVTAVPAGEPLGPALAALDALEDLGVIALSPAGSTGLTATDTRAAADYAASRRAVVLVAPAAPATGVDPGGSVGDDPAALVAALGLSPTQAGDVAAYGPWLLHPQNGAAAATTPIGVVAGLLDRTDRTRGLWTAPAGVEAAIPAGLAPQPRPDAATLASAGVNPIRIFPGRGAVLWGARTLGDGGDGQRYLSARRLVRHVERSLDRGLQWAAFEPNGEALWAQVRVLVADFLLGLWQAGALHGQQPSESFFVHCDRTTMIRNDIDSGRLVVLVGIAPLRPAEFVVLRIGVPTADTPA